MKKPVLGVAVTLPNSIISCPSSVWRNPFIWVPLMQNSSCSVASFMSVDGLISVGNTVNVHHLLKYSHDWMPDSCSASDAFKGNLSGMLMQVHCHCSYMSSSVVSSQVLTTVAKNSWTYFRLFTTLSSSVLPCLEQ